MQKLRDKEIRLALLANLGRRSNAPRTILEEFHVCNGNAIADVVAVYKTLHCYEIKGETDSISRITYQSQFYDRAFPRITLITTGNHLRRAESIAPKHWGIMLANLSHNGSVIFKYIRAATRNPSYLPAVALQSLWRSELIKFPRVANVSVEKMNKHKIAELIASSASTTVINESLGLVLATRNSTYTMPGNPLPYTKYERKQLVSESLKV